MFDLSPQLLGTLAAAAVVGAFTASRQPGGLAGALARGARGTAIRGAAGLLIFGVFYVYATSR